MMRRRDLLRSFGAVPLAGLALGPLRPTAPDDVDVDLTLTAAPGEVALFPGELTRVWQFSAVLHKGPASTVEVLPGSYLGPVLRLRRGQRVRIRFVNRLAEDSIVHWHGLDVPEAADGHPRLAIGAGREYVYEFTVGNRAGTYWYHPHPHMRTGAQVMQGLAGLVLVGDAEEDALALPAGADEHLCVLQDRRFDARNQFIAGMAMSDMMTGTFGDRVCVSGRPQPTHEVAAGWQRVRLLNGSNARIYKLAWSHGAPITVIGGDGGLLERPVSLPSLTLAPGQRADVLLNLSLVPPGTDVHLDSLAYTATDAVSTMMGMAVTTPAGAPLRVMTLRVTRPGGARFTMPERLSTFDGAWALVPGAPERSVPLTFSRMQWLMAGRTFVMDETAPDETVAAGATHVWRITNAGAGMGMGMGMGMRAAHPIHLHGRQFRVLSRTGAETNTLRAGIVDAGWTDTVLVLPGETVRIQIPFGQHRGTFMYHCHILEHEDMGMMRNFRIV